MKHLLATVMYAVLITSSANASPTIPTNQMFRLNPQLNAVFSSISGRPISWIVPGDGKPISASPMVDDDRVYIATNGDHVLALNLDTGSAIWSFHADDQVMTQPLLVGKTIIVGVGNAKVVGYRPKQYVVLGTKDNEIVGISTTDGSPVWSIGLPATGMPTGIIQDGTYYHVDGFGSLFALNATDGSYLWRKDMESTTFMSAINFDRNTFVAAGNWPNRVYAFNAMGKRLWIHNFSALLSGFSDCPLAIYDGIVVGDYVANVNPNAYTDDLKPGVEHAYALRLSDGHLLWDRALESGIVPPYNMSAIPVINDGVIYLGSALGPFYHALSIQTGALLWVKRVGGAVKGAAAIVDGVVYFGDLSGDLWALQSSSGTTIGSLKLSDHFNVGSAISVRGSLIIGSQSGHIYAIPLNNIRGSVAQPIAPQPTINPRT